MQRKERVIARSKLRRGESERDVGEGLGEKKMRNFCPCPDLSANSRLSGSFSLKRDERERKIKKSRAGETVSPKTPLVQGILAQASHYSPKRVYQQKRLAQVLHISPRRDMFSLGEISCSFGTP